MGKGDLKGNKSAKGKGFDGNPQNINSTGQNRKSIASVNLELEAKGIQAANKNDIIDCYLRLINLDLKELESMVKEDKQPAMIRIVGKAILSGKGFDVIEKVLDRGIGKSDSTLKLEGEIIVEKRKIGYGKLDEE